MAGWFRLRAQSSPGGVPCSDTRLRTLVASCLLRAFLQIEALIVELGIVGETVGKHPFVEGRLGIGVLQQLHQHKVRENPVGCEPGGGLQFGNSVNEVLLVLVGDGEIEVNVGVVGSQAYRLLVFDDGVVGLANHVEAGSEVHARVGIGGLDLQRGPIVLNGRGILVAGIQQVGQIVMRDGELGVDADGLKILGCRTLGVSGFLQSVAEIVVSVGIVGFQHYNVAQLADGIGVVLAVHQQVGETVACIHVVGIFLNGGAILCHGVVVILVLLEQATGVVVPLGGRGNDGSSLRLGGGGILGGGWWRRG